MKIYTWVGSNEYQYATYIGLASNKERAFEMIKGQDRFNKLLEARNQLKKYTIDDVKDIIEEYKQKIKELQ